MTMTLISTTTVGSGGAASISVTGIPATYTDLKIVCSYRTTDASIGQVANMSFNSSTSSFTGTWLSGNGSSPTSSTAMYGPWMPGSASTSNTFGNGEVYITNYASTTLNKSFAVDAVTENNATTAYQNIHANLWSNTAAINEFAISPAIGNFVQYSTISVYGITKGSGGATVS